MAGFRSRLRKELESTRQPNAASLNPVTSHPKNIRGLTRLGAASSSNSAGLLRGGSTGRGSGPGVRGGVPLPLQTPSLRKENGGQDVTTSLVNRRPNGIDGDHGPSSGSVASGLEGMLSGGKSKIVPGWGVSQSTSVGAFSTRTAKDPTPSEMQQRQQQEQEALAKQQLSQQQEPAPENRVLPAEPAGKNVPWALIPPARSEFPNHAPKVTSLSSRRRRWGDEEDDSEEEAGTGDYRGNRYDSRYRREGRNGPGGYQQRRYNDRYNVGERYYDGSTSSADFRGDSRGQGSHNRDRDGGYKRDRDVDFTRDGIPNHERDGGYNRNKEDNAYDRDGSFRRQESVIYQHSESGTNHRPDPAPHQRSDSGNYRDRENVHDQDSLLGQNDICDRDKQRDRDITGGYSRDRDDKRSRAFGNERGFSRDGFSGEKSGYYNRENRGGSYHEKDRGSYSVGRGPYRDDRWGSRRGSYDRDRRYHDDSDFGQNGTYARDRRFSSSPAPRSRWVNDRDDATGENIEGRWAFTQRGVHINEPFRRNDDCNYRGFDEPGRNSNYDYRPRWGFEERGDKGRDGGGRDDRYRYTRKEDSPGTYSHRASAEIKPTDEPATVSSSPSPRLSERLSQPDGASPCAITTGSDTAENPQQQSGVNYPERPLSSLSSSDQISPSTAVATQHKTTHKLKESAKISSCDQGGVDDNEGVRHNQAEQERVESPVSQPSNHKRSDHEGQKVCHKITGDTNFASDTSALSKQRGTEPRQRARGASSAPISHDYNNPLQQKTMQPFFSENSTPMVLLRNNNVSNNDKIAKVAESNSQMSGEESKENDVVPPSIGSLTSGGGASGALSSSSSHRKFSRALGSGKRDVPPHAWAPTPPVVPISLSSTLESLKAEERRSSVHSSQLVRHTDGKKKQHETPPVIPKPTLSHPASKNLKEVKKDKKELALEQQQNVLLQVEERRAAVAAIKSRDNAAEKSKTSAKKGNKATHKNEKDGDSKPVKDSQGKPRAHDLSSSSGPPDPSTKAGSKDMKAKIDSKTNPIEKKNSETESKKDKESPMRRKGEHATDGNIVAATTVTKPDVAEESVSSNEQEIKVEDSHSTDKGRQGIGKEEKKKRKRGPRSKESMERREKAAKKRMEDAKNRRRKDRDERKNTIKEMSAPKQKAPSRQPTQVSSENQVFKASVPAVSPPSKERDSERKVSPKPPSEEAKPNSSKPFVPAPTPAVSAWTAGPPPGMRTASTSPVTTQSNSQKTAPLPEAAAPPTPAASSSVSAAKPNQQTKSPTLPESEVRQADKSVSSNSPAIVADSNIGDKPILPPPGAVSLFPGNSVVFGDPSETSTAYGSWSPPPIFISSSGMMGSYVDSWKPNPFAPTTANGNGHGHGEKNSKPQLGPLSMPWMLEGPNTTHAPSSVTTEQMKTMESSNTMEKSPLLPATNETTVAEIKPSGFRDSFVITNSIVQPNNNVRDEGKHKDGSDDTDCEDNDIQIASDNEPIGIKEFPTASREPAGSGRKSPYQGKRHHRHNQRKTMGKFGSSSYRGPNSTYNRNSGSYKSTQRNVGNQHKHIGPNAKKGKYKGKSDERALTQTIGLKSKERDSPVDIVKNTAPAEGSGTLDREQNLIEETEPSDSTSLSKSPISSTAPVLKKTEGVDENTATEPPYDNKHGGGHNKRKVIRPPKKYNGGPMNSGSNSKFGARKPSNVNHKLFGKKYGSNRGAKSNKPGVRTRKPLPGTNSSSISSEAN